MSALVGPQRAVVEKEVGVADDAVERRPDLVTDESEEIRLRLARDFRLDAGERQLLLDTLADRDVTNDVDETDRCARLEQARRIDLDPHPMALLVA